MKTKIQSFIAVFALGLMLIFTGCGESVDPANADLKVVMKATTVHNIASAGSRVAGISIEFTEARIGVTEIEFESEEEHDDHSGQGSDDDGNDDGNDDSHHSGDHDEYEIEFEGQFVVDLLTGTSDPDFGIADLLPGTYKEIEVKIDPVMDDGNSVFIAFNLYADDTTAVEISTSRSFKLEVENESGIMLDGNAINQVLIQYDLDKILGALDLSQAVADEDGVVRINENSNADIIAGIISNFYQACDAGEDDDGDDHFDDDSDDD